MIRICPMERSTETLFCSLWHCTMLTIAKIDLGTVVLYSFNFNRSRELYAAVPGVRQSMLGVHAKRFGEKYRHLQVEAFCPNISMTVVQMVRSRANSRIGSVQGSTEDLLALENDVVADETTGETSSEGFQGSEGLSSGGLIEGSHHKVPLLFSFSKLFSAKSNQRLKCSSGLHIQESEWLLGNQARIWRTGSMC